MLIQDFKSGITTLAIRVYYEKGLVLADTSNPNTSISKIIYLIRPVYEWSEIAFWAPQNAENEHCKHLRN